MNASFVKCYGFKKYLVEIKEVASGLQNPKIVAEPPEINVFRTPKRASRMSEEEQSTGQTQEHPLGEARFVGSEVVVRPVAPQPRGVRFQ